MLGDALFTYGVAALQHQGLVQVLQAAETLHDFSYFAQVGAQGLDVGFDFPDEVVATEDVLVGEV